MLPSVTFRGLLLACMVVQQECLSNVSPLARMFCAGRARTRLSAKGARQPAAALLQRCAVRRTVCAAFPACQLTHGHMPTLLTQQ